MDTRLLMTLEEIGVLIVDDVNTMRALIKELLLRLGFKQVVSVDGVTNAIVALHQQKFHILLCDWRMNPLDGLVLLQYIREEPKLKGIGFIMVTAESSMDQVALAIQAGIDDYLVKPFSADQMKTKVTKLLIKKQVIPGTIL